MEAVQSQSSGTGLAQPGHRVLGQKEKRPGRKGDSHSSMKSNALCRSESQPGPSNAAVSRSTNAVMNPL